MTTGTAGKPSQRDKRTIILPITQEEYEQIVHNPMQFRAWIDKNYRLHPEIFPENFDGKYKLHDHKTSEKIVGLMTRGANALDFPFDNFFDDIRSEFGRQSGTPHYLWHRLLALFLCQKQIPNLTNIDL